MHVYPPTSVNPIRLWRQSRRHHSLDQRDSFQIVGCFDDALNFASTREMFRNKENAFSSPSAIIYFFLATETLWKKWFENGKTTKNGSVASPECLNARMCRRFCTPFSQQRRFPHALNAQMKNLQHCSTHVCNQTTLPRQMTIILFVLLFSFIPVNRKERKQTKKNPSAIFSISLSHFTNAQCNNTIVMHNFIHNHFPFLTFFGWRIILIFHKQLTELKFLFLGPCALLVVAANHQRITQMHFAPKNHTKNKTKFFLFSQHSTSVSICFALCKRWPQSDIVPSLIPRATHWVH